jgi:hypothetical protein
MYDIETLQRTIDSCERDTDSLIARYGTGVRPSWVSTDIVINQVRIEKYRKMLAAELAKQGDPK